jgi:hypothetical protein
MDSSVSNDQISAETWYALNFDPDWSSTGKKYILEILSTSTSTDHGLRFLYSPQPELDLGKLSENGQAVQEDIVLQYGCITGLQKIWLTGGP